MASSSTVSSESVSRPDSQSSPGDSFGIQACSLRWRSGCYFKYCAGACRDEKCPHLHDLTASEVRQFVAWKRSENHVVFDSSNSEQQESDRAESSTGHPGNGTSDVGNHAGNQESSLGPLPSRGSALHAGGKCTPCILLAKDGCPEGYNCGKCHFQHQLPKHKTKPRPCKEKRDRYRKLVSRIASRIEKNPDAFDPGNMEMMPSVAANEVLRRKLTARMINKAEEVRSERMASQPTGSQENPASPSAATSVQDNTTKLSL